MSNYVDYTEAYRADAQEYDKARDELYSIHLPYDIKDHPIRATNIEELNEETQYYHDVIKDITDNEDFVVLSNSEGTECRERVGGIYIWYRNNHLKQIELAELTTYKDITMSSLGPGDLGRMLKYLKRYYNMYRGEVIEILFVQDNSFAWTLKETKMTRDINGNVDEVYTDEITKYDISGKRFIYNNWGLGSY